MRLPLAPHWIWLRAGDHKPVSQTPPVQACNCPAHRKRIMSKKTQSSNSSNFLEWLESLPLERYNEVKNAIANLSNKGKPRRHETINNNNIPTFIDPSILGEVRLMTPIRTQVVIAQPPHDAFESGNIELNIIPKSGIASCRSALRNKGRRI